MKPLQHLVVAAIGIGALGAACARRPPPPSAAAPHAPPHASAALKNDSPFAPAFARVEGSPVDVVALGDPIQCERCHSDVTAQWDVSAHHASSFTNRFYAVAVDLTRKDKGNTASRWCAGCHDPSLLLEGAIDKDDPKASPRAGDGIGCLLCHSTKAPSRLGGGGWVLDWRGFKEPDVKDASSVAAHKTQMKTPAMNSGEFCASCHKVSIQAEVNGKRWLRGQDDFDQWEQGPYALGGAHATANGIYAPEVAQTDCQGCHMANESAPSDLAAKPDAHGEKVVHSHRFLAANTALGAYAHDPATVDAESKMLEGAMRVEVAAVRALTNPLKAVAIDDPSLASATGGFAIDVVVENARVGHKFPGGTADSNQAWLSLEVYDATGKLVAESGALNAAGDLDPEAHVFGVLQLDGDGKPATMRDAHRFVAAGWDTTIAPKDARVVRFSLPGVALGGASSSDVTPPLSITAKLRYRKFSKAYSDLACRSPAASLPPLVGPCPTLPIVDVAGDSIVLGAPRDESGMPPKWKRLDAYGRGLLQALQEDVGVADPILKQVVALAPDHADGFIDLARLFIREGRTADAYAELDLAAKIDGATPVIPFLRGVAKYETYSLGEAVDPLRLAAAGAPKDVMSTQLLAEALEIKGDDLGALDVTQKGLLVDPEDAQLHHLEALAFDKLGLPAEAAIARAAYLEYRVDDDRPRLRTICKKTIPGCAREAMPLHTHELVLAQPAK